MCLPILHVMRMPNTSMLSEHSTKIAIENFSFERDKEQSVPARKILEAINKQSIAAANTTAIPATTENKSGSAETPLFST